MVTAENGSQKTYILNVNVEDVNPIEITIDGHPYTVVKNGKNLVKPEFYEEKQITIDSFEIPAFYSDVTKFTLVGVKAENGEISLAIYDETKQSYLLYHEFTGNNSILYITDFAKPLEGYIKDKIKINDLEVEVYRYKDKSRFVICYALDVTTGNYNYYSYDTKENTFQIYNEEQVNDLEKEAQNYLYVCIAFGVSLVVCCIIIICLFANLEKRRNKSKKAPKSNKPKSEEMETLEDPDVQDLVKEMKKQKKKKK